MTLEQQVTNLELSKKLKTLGVKQDSHFVWCEHPDGQHVIGVEEYSREDKTLKLISAFTVAELGEMLPWEIGGKLNITTKCSNGSWVVWYEKNVIGAIVGDEKILDQGADTEADARAKMLIYLIENNLIDVKDLLK